jgi:hypothetical protein
LRVEGKPGTADAGRFQAPDLVCPCRSAVGHPQTARAV